MKKNFLLFFAGSIILSACQKTTINDSVNAADEQTTPIAGRKCASVEVLNEQLKADPNLKGRMDAVEAFTKRYISSTKLQRLSTVGDTMIIPVVVNVLYKTASENLNILQIQSQIDVLNEDFKGTNRDIGSVPLIFTGVTSIGMKIRFVLDSVVRKSSTKKSWGTNDAMKKSSLGGIDPTSPTTRLNMWACTLGNNLLGYAQFPGGSPATDGVVILNSAFGSRTKYPAGYFISTYDLGRTASHEVGHWLNLRHIWGDANCGNDFVGDTPLHTSANYNCPTDGVKSTCTGAPVMMTMNYMDYTADRCMYMFTDQQVSRMEATYAVGGPRATFR